tara:strand:+ start:163 stop:339 length:177 start_codon:yes stop_codon:yes gene_type:complete
MQYQIMSVKETVYIGWKEYTRSYIMINFFKRIYQKIIIEIRFRKKVKNLKKKDPFIYK